MSEEKIKKNSVEAAADEVRGQSADTVSRFGNTEVSGGLTVDANGVNNAVGTAATNPMTKKNGTTTKNARKIGDTTVSGAMDITVNNENVKDEWNNLDDIAASTYGLNTIRGKYGTDGYENPTVDMSETGNITLNGKDTGIKAADAANATNADIAKGWEKATGGTIAQASTYAGLAELGDLVKYNDDKLTVGGIEVPYAYIDNNGRAYVSKNLLDSVISKVKEQTGIENPVTLTKNTLDDYKKDINSAMDKITNRDEWNYDPATDPAYQAYAKQYQRNAEQAYNRAMGSGGLYGSPNSYNVYQAIAGYGDQMQKLSDVIPTLQQQDYSRYSDEQARNLQVLEALQNERAANLSALTTANDNMYNRYNTQDNTNYSRREDALYNYKAKDQELQSGEQNIQLGEDKVAQSAIDTDLYQANADADFRQKSANIDSTKQDTLSQQIENAFARAQANGGIFLKSDMDILGIPQDLEKYPDTNGYPTIYDSEIAQEMAQWAKVDKPKAEYTAALAAMY